MKEKTQTETTNISWQEFCCVFRHISRKCKAYIEAGNAHLWDYSTKWRKLNCKQIKYCKSVMSNVLGMTAKSREEMFCGPHYK
jgi:hypothetical protein